MELLMRQELLYLRRLTVGYVYVTLVYTSLVELSIPCSDVGDQGTYFVSVLVNMNTGCQPMLL